MIVLPTLKTARLYLHSSWQNTGMWRTDRRTDGQTQLVWLLQRFALRSMRTRCKDVVMNIIIMYGSYGIHPLRSLVISVLDHFVLAIRTHSDGFTHITTNYGNQISNQETAPSCMAWHTKCARQSRHRKQYGVLYRGKAGGDPLSPADT